MIDHLIIIETRAGSAEVLFPALRDWDFGGDPWILSLADYEVFYPPLNCNNIFLGACQRIEEFMEDRKVRPAVSRVVAVVDFVVWERLNALNTTAPYERSKSSPLIALIILAFPEIFWGFAHVESSEGAAPGEECPSAHRLEKWFAKGHGKPPPFEPLMDIWGLRDHVRRIAADNLKIPSDAEYEPLQFRKERAVALDDESAYAYFNAYTAYRHGFRSSPLSSWEATINLLAVQLDDGSPTMANSSPMVSFEDLYISFPDVPENASNHVRMSDLYARDNKFPLLKGVKYRVMLTSGTKRKGWRKLALELERRKMKRLLKPIGGMFSMWRACGLWRQLRIQDRDRKHWIGGYAPGYHPGVTVDPNDQGVGHSAPGALMSVAEVLLERAERIKKDMITVEEVIVGAVLATDAFELLASRTPTLSLDALILKHEFEVIAECRFNGVQNHFDVHSRLRKIQKAVKMLSRWFDPGQQDVARWNAETSVIGSLKGVFSQHEQFDEEAVYTTRSRALHRRLWSRNAFGKVLGTWLRHLNPVYWVAWYVSFLLRGIPTFVLMVILWLAVLSVGFYKIEPNTAKLAVKESASQEIGKSGVQESGVPRMEHDKWFCAMENAFSCFVSIGPPIRGECFSCCKEGAQSFAYFWACVAMGSGFLHLGILISHLYTVVSRK